MFFGDKAAGVFRLTVRAGASLLLLPSLSFPIRSCDGSYHPPNPTGAYQ